MAKRFETKWFVNSTLEGYSYKECFKTTYFAVIYYYSIMSLCFLVGTPAYSWCLWLYLRRGWRIEANQMIFINHIIIELMACIENAFEVLNEFILHNHRLYTAIFFLFGALWTGRPLMQTCICIERYVAVVHPVTFLKYKAMKYKLAAVVMVYLISFAYGLYETTSQLFPDPVFNSVYFVVVITVLYCCVSVLCALKKTGPGENQQKKKAFKIISSTLIIMLLTYSPMVVLTVCYAIKDDWVLFNCILGPILVSFSYYNLIIIPLLKIYKEGYLRKSKQRN